MSPRRLCSPGEGGALAPGNTASLSPGGCGRSGFPDLRQEGTSLRKAWVGLSARAPVLQPGSPPAHVASSGAEAAGPLGTCSWAHDPNAQPVRALRAGTSDSMEEWCPKRGDPPPNLILKWEWHGVCLPPLRELTSALDALTSVSLMYLSHFW